MDKHNLPTQKLPPAPAQEELEDVENKIEDFESDSQILDIEQNDAPIPSPKVNIDIDKSYNTGGITIEFPYRPYQSQKEMMSSIISGVNHGRHCLLESPTGTGKTAALLCALRAWQIACKADVNRLQSARDAKLEDLEPDPLIPPKCTCGFIPSNINKDNIKIERVPSGRFFKEIYNLWIRVYSEDANDKESEESKGSPNKISKFDPNLTSEEIRGVDKLCPYCIHTHLIDKTRPPRIYYGTRTHSQIAQIVKELKNSPYSENIKITVLASRKNYCVNPDLIKDPNSIDDKCAKLRKNYFINKKNENKMGKEKEKPLPTCSHFEGYQKANHRNISTEFSDKVRDIEDLKNECDFKCPYYISRSLHEVAEIIFLPYNYLIQPNIRRFTGVVLAGSIVVLDEAHNIESACMEAASQQVNLSKLNFETRRELDEAILFMPTLEQLEANTDNNIWDLNLMRQKLLEISTFLKSFSTWLVEKDKKLFPFIHKPGNQRNSKEIKMEAMLQEWRDAMMSEEEVNKILFSLHRILHENNEFISSFSSHYAKHIMANPNNSTPQFNFQKLLKSIDRFFCILNFLYAKKSMNLDDFVATLEHICKKGDSTSQIKKCNPDIIFKLNCLNPGLAFAILKNACHSVIVTSGTLSPMDNISHELETKFGETLSANHAIPEKNVLASFLSKYSMHSINWNSYGQKWSTNFDILGEAILQIAEVVPKGVLVFVASYGFLEKLKNQWETVPEQNFNNIPPIPLQLRLNIVKKAFWEIRDGNLNAKEVEKYKTLIKDGGGAIYFGVFRGKISEGVDFKGDHARAVISIGIPYQCIGPEVEAKKKYVNDKKIPGYTGQVWYDTEAYRAINQALGRCIRDTTDWGALILLDLRFAELFQSRLADPFDGRFSRWIKPKYTLDLQTLIESLQEFVLEMQNNSN